MKNDTFTRSSRVISTHVPYRMLLIFFMDGSCALVQLIMVERLERKIARWYSYIRQISKMMTPQLTHLCVLSLFCVVYSVFTVFNFNIYPSNYHIIKYLDTRNMKLEIFYLYVKIDLVKIVRFVQLIPSQCLILLYLNIKVYITQFYEIIKLKIPYNPRYATHERDVQLISSRVSTKRLNQLS